VGREGKFRGVSMALAQVHEAGTEDRGWEFRGVSMALVEYLWLWLRYRRLALRTEKVPNCTYLSNSRVKATASVPHVVEKVGTTGSAANVIYETLMQEQWPLPQLLFKKTRVGIISSAPTVNFETHVQ
jgi:hypothetical protein